MAILDSNSIREFTSNDLDRKTGGVFGDLFGRSENPGLDSVGVPFTDEHRNKFVKGLYKDPLAINDPTFLGFTLLFDWQDSPLFRDDIDNGATYEYTDSAYRYLERIGQSQKQLQLKQFKEKLQTVNRDMPWYWQSIEGLEGVWEKYHNIKEPYLGGDDSIITINTLESIDFSITGLLELYRNVAYDFKNRREVLPENMREFNLIIFVEEIRKFRSFRLNTNDATSTTMVDMATPYLAIVLKKCQFLPGKSTNIFNNLNNMDSTMVTQSLSFSYADIEIRSELPWFDFKITANPPTSNDEEKTRLGRFIDKKKKSLQNSAQKAADRFVKQNISSLTSLAHDKAMKLIKDNLGLGNIYDKGYNILSGLRNANIKQLINMGEGKPSSSGSDVDQLVGSNIYGNTSPNTNTETNLGNVYN